MQNRLLNSFLSLALMFSIAVAQDRQPLSHFSGMQTGKLIQVTFVVRAGIICNGIKIMRSTNEHDFSQIGQLTGMCGNSTSDETYSFTDIFPVKNTDNFYQLDLANMGLSDIIKIHFTDFGDKGYLLYPNPLKDKSMLYFQNDCNDEMDFVLLNKRGKKVREISNVRSNAIEIEKGKLKSGMYNFQLFIDKKMKYSGSLVIL